MTENLAKSLRVRRKPVGQRLTEMSSCAGCAAKLNQTLLAEILAKLPRATGGPRNANVLVGADTFDDAGVYRLSRELALVQTVDFFTPIVDDPFDFGQIAAANAISDIFAMGGRPVTALNLLGVPSDRLAADTISQILQGGAKKAAEANCSIIGGHTIRLPEPVYGMSVTGRVHPDRILSNNRARVGDVLLLTKPLGTGIATTAIKRQLASVKLAKRAVRSMKRLNTPGAELAERGLVLAATDVTGFGLLGHLGNILRGSGVGAILNASAIPALSSEVFSLIERDCIPGGTRNNLDAAEQFTDWGVTDARIRVLLADAQTSGGLILCTAPKKLAAVRALLRSHRTISSSVIGQIVRSPAGRILVQP